MIWSAGVAFGEFGHGVAWSGGLELSRPLQRLSREQQKERCFNYLGGKKCFNCENNSFSYEVYDFHHAKGNKKFSISEALTKNVPWRLLREELDKCVILCSNCHRQVTKGILRLPFDELVERFKNNKQ